jgi:hypothetical protein
MINGSKSKSYAKTVKAAVFLVISDYQRQQKYQ